MAQLPCTKANDLLIVDFIGADTSVTLTAQSMTRVTLSPTIQIPSDYQLVGIVAINTNSVADTNVPLACKSFSIYSMIIWNFSTSIGLTINTKNCLVRAVYMKI